ncbi:hypothetical protein CMI37_09185 [Candidatus Pacearchaeota archaeon]|nr:hypothetical protein [Candidatus Pacearchaeota archaeon]|tara:strand:+ start:3059 stop:4084 length:1026 start_codon:yes stop_codon:yes gene_type:complete
MAKAFSGREFSVIVGIADNNTGSSLGAVGADTQDANAVSGSKVLMRVDSPVNMFDYSASYQRAEIARAGTRTIRSLDIINHYGSGVWTWDFNWLVDNEKGIQNLLHLMHPLHGDTITTSITYDGTIAPANYEHGNDSDEDKCAFIIIQNPLTTRDHYMHSAILQELTLSMDAGTDGGALRASGQFMSGYKPTIESNGVTADTSASDYAKGLFDCTTSTFGGDAAVVKSFSLTLSNPANRIGYQGAEGETDGYVRSGNFGITGSITMKSDSLQQINDDTFWKANATAVIGLGNTASLHFALAAVNVSNISYDMAEEGAFQTVDFVATSGTAGTGDLAVLKIT